MYYLEFNVMVSYSHHISWNLLYHGMLHITTIVASLDYITNHYELSTIYICVVEDKAERRKTSAVA